MPEFDSTVRYSEVTGFPGHCVGTDGSVWSRHNMGPGSKLLEVWHQLKPVKQGKYGHRTVCLYPGQISRLVHRLVLETFVGPCPEGMEGCHNDGDHTNNQLGNLRWDTHQENIQDRDRHNRTARGQRAGGAKLTEEQVLQIRAEHAASPSKYGLTKRLASKYHVSPGIITRIVRRHNWKHL